MLGLLVSLLAMLPFPWRSGCPEGDLIAFTLCWANWVVQCNVFHHC